MNNKNFSLGALSPWSPCEKYVDYLIHLCVNNLCLLLIVADKQIVIYGST